MRAFSVLQEEWLHFHFMNPRRKEKSELDTEPAFVDNRSISQERATLLSLQRSTKAARHLASMNRGVCCRSPGRWYIQVWNLEYSDHASWFVALQSIFAHESSLDRDLLFKVDSEPLQTPKPEAGIEPANSWTEDQSASHSDVVGYNIKQWFRIKFIFG